jgi:hypothetical protein
MGGFTLRYPSLLKVMLENDSIQVRRGSTAAYRGEVTLRASERGPGMFIQKGLEQRGPQPWFGDRRR